MYHPTRWHLLYNIREKKTEIWYSTLSYIKMLYFRTMSVLINKEGANNILILKSHRLFS